METRVIVAYLLILALILAAVVGGVIAMKRHRKRQRVQRGYRQWRPPVRKDTGR